MDINGNLAFGIDISKHQYSEDGRKKMDFEAVARHTDPFVSFVVARSGVSWGYQDAWFARNWEEIGKIPAYRARLIEQQAWDLIVGLPARKTLCGRGAYHVLYPGEDATKQADNLFRIVGETADFAHDRLVIDAELDHGQSRRRITDCIMQFAEVCRARSGRYPILYARTRWLYDYTYWEDLWHLDMWLAQYRYALTWPLYTPEYESPPVLGYGADGESPRVVDDWLIHQTADKGKSIGGNSYYMEYNRWQGTHEDVLRYFGYAEGMEEPKEPEEPETPEPPVEQHDLAWLIEMHEDPSKHPPVG